MNTKPTLHYLGHRERLRERFENSGLKGFCDYEILELALSFALPRKDIKPLAKELIRVFGSLKQVLDASSDDLKQVQGISDFSASYIKFLREYAALYAFFDIKTSEKLYSPETVSKYLTSLLGGQVIEKLYSILLNSGNKVIDSIELESGTVNKSVIIPRKIVEIALKNKAASIILAHNHPGGTLKPSQNDIDATNALKEALSTVDVSLTDHIIVSGKDYFSFKEYGLL